MSSYIAWHFCRDNRRMAYGDGRLIEVGKTYRTIYDDNHHKKAFAAKRPGLCEIGMHGSLKALDALNYAPGFVCCLTEIYGSIQLGDDKLVGESRKVLKMVDAKDIILQFAKNCALDVLSLWDAPQIVIDFLNGADAAAHAADAAYAAYDAYAAAHAAAARAAADADAAHAAYAAYAAADADAAHAAAARAADADAAYAARAAYAAARAADAADAARAKEQKLTDYNSILESSLLGAMQ